MSLFHSQATKKEDKSSKVYSLSSPRRVPFSWEEEPGISKKSLLRCPTESESAAQSPKLKLPPPPPCALQPKNSVKNNRGNKSMVRYEDPFLAALMECTKSAAGHQKDAKKKGCPSRSKLVDLSCKQSCDVREGTMLRFRSDEDRSLNFDPSNDRVSTVRSSLKSQQMEKVRG